ncbi:hypothetical protein [Actinomadura litoris]|uniref:Uncharacterized protein n=1 Tax=Actinomadura litoris TaxID=2678616 RepID=A0A7K1KTW5_9ACTN|nr:hypothetical protein [Actinomadura litoris]MUN35475.1 hypothetical protein [Actinomadura litoris]
MTHHPPIFPPVQQWPILAGPDCPTCGRDTDVTWIGPTTTATGAEVSVWHCRACPTDWPIPTTRWPVLDGPDCPRCHTEITSWAALAPNHGGDLWTCHHGHEFVHTPEGLIILPGDAA